MLDLVKMALRISGDAYDAELTVEFLPVTYTVEFVYHGGSTKDTYTRGKMPTVPKIAIDMRIFSFPFIPIPPVLPALPIGAGHCNGGSFLYTGR